MVCIWPRIDVGCLGPKTLVFLNFTFYLLKYRGADNPCSELFHPRLECALKFYHSLNSIFYKNLKNFKMYTSYDGAIKWQLSFTPVFLSNYFCANLMNLSWL